MHAVANAVVAVDLITTDPALRKAVMDTLGLMGDVLSDSNGGAWGERMEIIRGLMRAELDGPPIGIALPPGTSDLASRVKP